MNLAGNIDHNNDINCIYFICAYELTIFKYSTAHNCKYINYGFTGHAIGQGMMHSFGQEGIRRLSNLIYYVTHLTLKYRAN